MRTVLKARIVKIGNSHGIRIPKLVLDQFGDVEDVEMEVQPGALIIRPVQCPRQGWEEQFRAMAAQGDDVLLDEPLPSLTHWDEEEWEWS